MQENHSINRTANIIRTFFNSDSINI